MTDSSVCMCDVCNAGMAPPHSLTLTIGSWLADRSKMKWNEKKKKKKRQTRSMRGSLEKLYTIFTWAALCRISLPYQIHWREMRTSSWRMVFVCAMRCDDRTIFYEHGNVFNIHSFASRRALNRTMRGFLLLLLFISTAKMVSIWRCNTLNT